MSVENFIKFRFLCIVHQVIFTSEPLYLYELITNYNPPRNLTSQTQNLLSTPRIDSNIGRRAFTFQAPTLWNNLPLDLKNIPKLPIFKTKLKKFLFDLQF